MSLSLIKSQFQKNKIGWRKSFLDGFAQDDRGENLPWATYPFIEFITPKLKPHHEVFEFGSGSSTLFFAKRVKKVVAIEHDKLWFEAMKIKLRENGVKNVELILMENALLNSDYENYAMNYVFNSHLCENDEKNVGFDFILIDSLKRFVCAKNSVKALKSKGALIIDDSERKHYQKIFDFLLALNFQKYDFVGIAPGQFRLKNTTIFFQNALYW